MDYMSHLLDSHVSNLESIYDDKFNSLLLDYYEFLSKKPYYYKSQQNKIMSKLQSHLDDFYDKYEIELKEAVDFFSNAGRTTAINNLIEIEHEEIDENDNDPYLYDDYFIAIGFVATQINRMAAQIRADMRKRAVAVVRQSKITGLTLKETAKKMSVEISKDDFKLKFSDNAGRQWDAKKYIKMLTKTVIANAWRNLYIDTAVANGVDLVRISTHNATDKCKPYEGKIISLTGATEGYLTYDALKTSNDIFHPNCRHFFRAVAEE